MNKTFLKLSLQGIQASCTVFMVPMSIPWAYLHMQISSQPTEAKMWVNITFQVHDEVNVSEYSTKGHNNSLRWTLCTKSTLYNWYCKHLFIFLKASEGLVFKVISYWKSYVIFDLSSPTNTHPCLCIFRSSAHKIHGWNSPRQQHVLTILTNSLYLPGCFIKLLCIFWVDLLLLGLALPWSWSYVISTFQSLGLVTDSISLKSWFGLTISGLGYNIVRCFFFFIMLL